MYHMYVPHPCPCPCLGGVLPGIGVLTASNFTSSARRRFSMGAFPQLTKRSTWTCRARSSSPKIRPILSVIASTLAARGVSAVIACSNAASRPSMLPIAVATGMPPSSPYKTSTEQNGGSAEASPPLCYHASLKDSLVQAGGLDSKRKGKRVGEVNFTE